MIDPSTPAEAIFSIHDVAVVAGIVRRRYSTVVDEDTLIGTYVRALERSVVALEDEGADWQLRHSIAVGERNRAERRVGDLEGAVDAVLAAVRKMSAA